MYPSSWPVAYHSLNHLRLSDQAHSEHSHSSILYALQLVVSSDWTCMSKSYFVFETLNGQSGCSWGFNNPLFRFEIPNDKLLCSLIPMSFWQLFFRLQYSFSLLKKLFSKYPCLFSFNGFAVSWVVFEALWDIRVDLRFMLEQVRYSILVHKSTIVVN